MQEIQGWLTPEVARAMRDLILNIAPRVCVEIGVFYGKSLINTAEALGDVGKGIVYGIDPWRKSDALAALTENDNPTFWEQLDYDEVHKSCAHTIWERGLEEYAVPIRARSSDARKLWRRSSIDILYIDGGHTEILSCSDVAWYLPKVKYHGHIWFDDADWQSTQKALWMLGEECALVEDFGNARLYQKQ